jgi:hypothetical protein
MSPLATSGSFVGHDSLPAIGGCRARIDQYINCHSRVCGNLTTILNCEGMFAAFFEAQSDPSVPKNHYSSRHLPLKKGEDMAATKWWLCQKSRRDPPKGQAFGKMLVRFDDIETRS